MKDIIKLSAVPPIVFVNTGIPELNELVGGYPRGRVTQLYGLSSTGKTSIMVRAMAAASSNHKILYCDVENSINVDRFKELGADLDKVDYTNKAILEDVCELIRNSIDKYDLIILDSIAMLTPQTEHAGELGQANVGLKPRLLGQWLRIIEGDLGKSKTALVLINQMRRSMELYGEKYVLPGGMQLKFSSSLMIQLSTVSADKIIKDKQQVGHFITARVTKSKVSAPMVSTRFKLLYS